MQPKTNPIIRAMPERKRFFSIDPFPKLFGSKMFEPLSKVLWSSHRVTEFSSLPPVMIIVSPSGIPHE